MRVSLIIVPNSSYILIVQKKNNKAIDIIEREKNPGFKNIIRGIHDLFRKNNRLIILEDDLLVSNYVLKFMNEGLEIYGREDSISSIHGYVPGIFSNGIDFSPPKIL